MKAPFAYQGGKSKLAKQIVDHIWAGEDTHYVDLCCGAGSISIELANRGAYNITMIDAGPMGAFWQQVSEGTFDMEHFKFVLSCIPKDKTQIKGFMEELSKIPYTYVGEVISEYLVLQAAAFGAKQIYDEGDHFGNCSFRNYWLPTATSSRRSPVNPMMPMPEGLLKNVEKLVGGMSFVRATHTLAEYVDFKFIQDEAKEFSVVTYIDPPYAGTTDYAHSIELQKIINKAKMVGDVFVSEYAMKGADSVTHLSSTTKGGISGNASKIMVENLYKINKVDSSYEEAA